MTTNGYHFPDKVNFNILDKMSNKCSWSQQSKPVSEPVSSSDVCLKDDGVTLKIERLN